jgi:hypothetical protein
MKLQIHQGVHWIESIEETTLSASKILDWKQWEWNLTIQWFLMNLRDVNWTNLMLHFPILFLQPFSLHIVCRLFVVKLQFSIFICANVSQKICSKSFNWFDVLHFMSCNRICKFSSLFFSLFTIVFDDDDDDDDDFWFSQPQNIQTIWSVGEFSEFWIYHKIYKWNENWTISNEIIPFECKQKKLLHFPST